MSVTKSPVRCPVCQSHGAMLHHDMRASLVYSCQQCLHAWQIDPAEEPLQADPTVRVVLAMQTSPSAELSTSSTKAIKHAGV